MNSDPKTQHDSTAVEFRSARLDAAADVQLAVDEATSHKNAIILVHVDWAPMVPQRRRFEAFVLAYRTKNPEHEIAFRYIDCTPVCGGYEPLRSIPGWQVLEQINGGGSLLHGYGELAWIKNNRVLHVQRPLDFESVDALIDKTESLEMANGD
ncbi:MAG: hypothetical protein AB7I37_12220 [Pirellulales bacterium]